MQYYKREIADDMHEYFLSDGNDAVSVSHSVGQGHSTASTHADIMDDLEKAEEVSESEVPDEIADKLQRGADTLL